MFVQVVTFSLEGISEDEYIDVAVGLAPRFASLPGLLAKIWLENPGGNRYGAVYFWEDAESMERFGDSDLFEGGTAEFAAFVSEEFRVLENLTAQTQPALQVLEAGGGFGQRATAGRGSAKKAAAAVGQTSGVKRTPPLKRATATTGAAKKSAVTKAAPTEAPGTGGAARAAGKAAKAGKKAMPATTAAKTVTPARTATKKATPEKAVAKTTPAKKAVVKKAGRKAAR